MATEPGLHHAVELVHAEGDGLDQGGGIADTHQVARAVGREVGQGGGEGREHLLPRLPHRQPADAVAVEVELDRPLRALGPQRVVDPALDDAEQGLVRPIVSGPGPLGPGRGPLDREADHRGSGDGSGGQTSSAIWMSAPRSCCVVTADSGVRRWIEPS